MSRMQRAKGARGEREAAAELERLFACRAHRGRQFQGTDESPDVKCSLPGLHFEVKRTEALSVYAAMAQANADCGEARPVVLHRRNERKWLAIVYLDDLPAVARILDQHRKESSDCGV